MISVNQTQIIGWRVPVTRRAPAPGARSAPVALRTCRRDHDTARAAHDVLAAEELSWAPGPGLHDEPAHDVLAAEEFPLGAGDPALHEEPAHDVLAAEEFRPAPATRR